MFGQLKWTFASVIIALIIIGGLKIHLNTVTAELAEAKAQIVTLKNQINDQNAAITQWRLQAAAAKQRLMKAESKAQTQETRINKDEQKILDQNVSPGCASAMRWGTFEARKMGAKW